LSIAEIALEVGCSCQTHLTNLFRKCAGTTPSACRTAANQTRRDAMATGRPVLRPLAKEIGARPDVPASELRSGEQLGRERDEQLLGLLRLRAKYSNA